MWGLGDNDILSCFIYQSGAEAGPGQDQLFYRSNAPGLFMYILHLHRRYMIRSAKRE